MKLRFTMTKEDIERNRAKLLEEKLQLRKLLKSKKITGNTRNAALREMLIPRFGTKVKVTKATTPKLVKSHGSGPGQRRNRDNTGRFSALTRFRHFQIVANLASVSTAMTYTLSNTEPRVRAS